MGFSRDVAKYFVVLLSMVNSIEKAGFGKSVVLTGALSLDMKLIEHGKDYLCRKTKDIDLSIRDETTYLRLFDNLESILNSNDCGIVFRLLKRRGYKSKGDSATLLCKYLNEELEVKVDMNIKSLDDSMICDVAAVAIPTYSDYTSLVDKVYTVCSERIFRRAKDTYDLYCYSMICGVSYKEFLSCVRRHRPDLLNNIQFTIMPFNYEKVRYAYEKNDSLVGLPFCEMWRRLSLFLNPLVGMIVSGEDVDATWDVTSEVWR